MKRLVHLLLFAFLAICVPRQEFGADPAKLLRADLNRIFSDNRLADAQLGIEVFSLDRSEILYEKNAQKLYVPASNNKILTSAAALVCLGPDYRFKTRVLTDGPVLGGVMTGDLIVLGFGDPSSSSRIQSKDPFLPFKDWAARLKQQGIHAISGDIIGDGGSFEETEHGQGWAWDDLTEGFAAPVSALQFNENLIEVEIKPGMKAGSLASIKTAPLADYLSLDSRVVTGAETDPPRMDVRRGGASEAVVIRGALPLRSRPLYRLVAVQSPVRYYLSALKYILSEEGIDVSKCEIRDTRGFRSSASSLLWTYTSPPLSELLPPILKLSLNLSSETLARVLGLELRGEGTFSGGKDVVEDALARMGINKESYSYADGSGLSRLNLVSADTLIQILKFMHQQQYFNEFYNALSIAGVDGTLAFRMKKTRAGNNVHAKTGSFANVSALSGYVQTADGEMLAFSILANNFLVPRDVVESVQNKTLIRLAGFSRRAQNKRRTINE
jgi:D-alanyl-D-alanine carboxypeptidase/D-alanyl-D-alanine-endopeptidase (penicillin-binding protein 4)